MPRRKKGGVGGGSYLDSDSHGSIERKVLAIIRFMYAIKTNKPVDRFSSNLYYRYTDLVEKGENGEYTITEYGNRFLSKVEKFLPFTIQVDRFYGELE